MTHPDPQPDGCTTSPPASTGDHTAEAAFAKPVDGWQIRAACAALPARWFFDARDDDEDDEPVIDPATGRVLAADPPLTPHERAEATDVCRRCPVRQECLLLALWNNAEHGRWGGAGEARRRTLRARRADGRLEAALGAHWRRLDGVLAEPGDAELLRGFGDRATHGRKGTYAKGCRCEACSAAIGRREVQASMRRLPRRPASGGAAA